MMDCMVGGDCMMGMMWLWWIFWIAIIAVAVWGVYRFTRRRSLGSRNQAAPPRTTPMETLQQRYAAGEVTTEEYEERKRRLTE